MSAPPDDLELALEWIESFRNTEEDVTEPLLHVLRLFVERLERLEHSLPVQPYL